MEKEGLVRSVEFVKYHWDPNKIPNYRQTCPNSEMVEGKFDRHSTLF